MNPQPTVLETATLPIELYPCVKSCLARLFGFFVFSVFLAELAILAEHYTVGIVLLVLDTLIIAIFALCATQCNRSAHDLHLVSINLSLTTLG